MLVFLAHELQPHEYCAVVAIGMRLRMLTGRRKSAAHCRFKISMSCTFEGKGAKTTKRGIDEAGRVFVLSP